MPQILTLNVSLHPNLLETRSQVLRTGGYTVVSAISLTEATNKFLSGDFDLVILCHSISPKDRRHLSTRLRNHSPLTPIVLVSATDMEEDASVDATVGNDPQQLLEELARILHTSKQGRTKTHQQRA